MPQTGNPIDWSPEDQQGRIYAALCVAANGGGVSNHEGTKCPVCYAAWRSLVPELGTGALRFYVNGPNGREEMPRGQDRSKRLRNKVREIHKYVSEGSWAETYAPKPEPAPAPAPVVEPEPAPADPFAFDVESEKQLFFSECRRIRRWIVDRSPDPDDQIDHISYRPLKDGRRMIEAGIPARACLHAMTMHWEPALRDQAGIADYDPATDFPGGLHAYLDALVKARVWIMLTGPAGFGKSYWAEALADRMDLSFDFTPMTEGATPSWFFGKETMGGYKGTTFIEQWRSGGVHLWDEWDRADPAMILALNNPLANRILKNPVSGEQIPQHENFIGIAAGNTLGFSDAKYTAAQDQDFSILDRFRMGRAYVGYDADVEHEIFWG